ncbi:unnamed protein product [Vitrella brassicaformis CCMP3155]|uniref:AP2/ERF domain-containing protein n=1 Tax=Vitrella brassicaformis (strain CCMP3155) TaxID=1169540 RepID=A0A0G4F5Y0_VITBC|nr:unnamed protein product [Vitrella brassicaformis CCMP3155]|eukprot:CEM07899.1 unnamed protein product [Vitrella brassicaformis CCMP3155]
MFLVHVVPRHLEGSGDAQVIHELVESAHQSGVPGVSWNENTQAWVASWWEKADGRHKHKTFYVKEHGDKAKALAEEHRLEMVATGRAAVQKPAEHQCGVRGVTYDKSTNSWRAKWKEGGDEEAKQMAIAHRRAMERLHYRFDRGGVEMPVEERPRKKRRRRGE